jgi:hypothetical protein
MSLPSPLSSYVEYSRTPTVVTTPVATSITTTASLGSGFTLVDMQSLLPHRSEIALEVQTQSGAVTSNTGPAVSLRYAWSSAAATYGALSAGSGAVSTNLRTAANADSVVVSDPMLAKARYLGLWVNSAALSTSAAATVTARVIAL